MTMFGRAYICELRPKISDPNSEIDIHYSGILDKPEDSKLNKQAGFNDYYDIEANI